MSTLQYIKHKNFILYINKRGKLVRAYTSYAKLCSLLKTKVLPVILYVPTGNEELNEKLVERIYFLNGNIPDWRNLTRGLEGKLLPIFMEITQQLRYSIPINK